MTIFQVEGSCSHFWRLHWNPANRRLVNCPYCRTPVWLRKIDRVPD